MVDVVVLLLLGVLGLLRLLRLLFGARAELGDDGEQGKDDRKSEEGEVVHHRVGLKVLHRGDGVVADEARKSSGQGGQLRVTQRTRGVEGVLFTLSLLASFLGAGFDDGVDGLVLFFEGLAESLDGIDVGVDSDVVDDQAGGHGPDFDADGANLAEGSLSAKAGAWLKSKADAAGKQVALTKEAAAKRAALAKKSVEDHLMSNIEEQLKQLEGRPAGA